MPSPQSKYYILTIPASDWQPPTELVAPIQWLYGQQEQGEGGYLHWQFLAYFSKKVTLTAAKAHFPNTAHLEPTRSTAAEEYVRKQDTRVEGTFFRYYFE